MRVIFLGTPEFAVKVLEEINKSSHEIVAVVCQEDKPTGRGNRVLPPAVKVKAMELGLPVYQFKKIRVDGVDTLKSLNADIMVTCAYGQILSQEIIDICKFGIINVHGSLLPKYRGASPIQSVLINGEKITGVTIMKTEAGIDTGDMLIKEECSIAGDDNYESLAKKLSAIGAGLAVKALDLIESGKAVFVPQNHGEASHCKMFKKEDTIIDFNKSAKEIVNLVRGLNPNPVAVFYLASESYKVWQAKEVDYLGQEQNGTILSASPKAGFIIKCEGGAVEIIEMTAPNSKRMLAKSYLNGKRISAKVVENM